MIRLFLLLVFSFSLMVLANGQTPLLPFQGKVVDADNLPLPNVQVTVRSMPDSTLKAFVTTNTNGEFDLTLREGSYYITFKLLGYHPFTQTIRISQEKKREVFLVVLAEKVETLQEVQIVEKQPIKVKKDSIIYEADYFRGEGDEKVIDVLKKIPGVEIDENRQLRYKGNLIKDLLVEGESLFHQSPETIANVFPAKALDKIEVLENFRSSIFQNPFSSEIAINLKVKQDYKNVIFGDALAAAGIPAHYQLNTNAFWVKKTLKTMLIADVNNVAKQVFNLSSALSVSENQSVLLSRTGARGKSTSECPPLMRSAFGSLNMVYTPDERFRWNHQSFWYRERLGFVSQNRKFFTGNTQLFFQEKSDWKDLFFFLNSTNTFSYKPNHQHHWQVQADIHPYRRQIEARRESVFLGLENGGQDFQRQQVYGATLALHQLWQPNEKKSLSSSIKVNYLPETKKSLLRSERPNLFTWSDTISQKSNIASWNSESSVTYRHHLSPKWLWEQKIIHQITKEIETFRLRGLEKVSDSLNTSDYYLLQRSAISGILHQKGQHVELQLRSDIAYYQLLFNSSLARRQEQKLLLEPSVRITFKPIFQQISISYSRQNQFPRRNDLNPSYRLETFRSAKQGNAEAVFNPTHQWEANYSLNLFFSQLMVIGHISHSKRIKQITSSFQTNFLYDIQGIIQRPSTQTIAFLSILKTFSGKIPFTLKGQLQTFSFHSENIFNGIVQPFANNTVTYQMKFFTQLKRRLNTEWSWRKDAVVFASPNTSPQRSSWQSIESKLLFKLFDKLTFIPCFEYIAIKNVENTRQKLLFVHAQLTVSISKKLIAQIEGFNLMGTHTIATQKVTPLYIQQDERNVMNRYVLIGIRHAF